MPRKRLTDKILEKIDKEIESDEKGSYIIVYDFGNRRYNPKEFYYAIMDLINNGHKIVRIQKSVYLTDSLRTALAIKELAKHYGAEVRVFKVEKEV
ncbi:hypothetical protein DRN38_00040 [Thermococci archaeon]|nr:MAG: hypothetical protein DRN38_00040 [Thermococci archaeon]